MKRLILKEGGENLLSTLRTIGKLPEYLHETNRQKVIEEWRDRNPLVAKVLEGNASISDAVAELAAMNSRVRFFARPLPGDLADFGRKAKEVRDLLSGILPAQSLNILCETPTGFRKAAAKSLVILRAFALPALPMCFLAWLIGQRTPDIYIVYALMSLAVWIGGLFLGRSYDIEMRHEEATKAVRDAKFLDRKLRPQAT